MDHRLRPPAEPRSRIGRRAPAPEHREPQPRSESWFQITVRQWRGRRPRKQAAGMQSARRTLRSDAGRASSPSEGFPWRPSPARSGAPADLVTRGVCAASDGAKSAPSRTKATTAAVPIGCRSISCQMEIVHIVSGRRFTRVGPTTEESKRFGGSSQCPGGRGTRAGAKSPGACAARQRPIRPGGAGTPARRGWASPAGRPGRPARSIDRRPSPCPAARRCCGRGRRSGLRDAIANSS